MPHPTASNPPGTIQVIDNPGQSTNRLSSITPAYEQNTYHPYSRSKARKGQLGTFHRFGKASNGQAEHPEWKFQQTRPGAVEVRSSDGISFWVPAYVLMAFSEELRSRIEAASTKDNQQAASRQAHAKGLGRPIIITLPKTHHRVLAIFLLFTQGRTDLIEMHTATQYWQCYDFAHAYGAKHFKSFLVDSLWLKMVKEDPMGSFAFACNNKLDEVVMETCFKNMGDHWCITVDAETEVAVWSTFERETYEVDTPVRCADAFASKMGLDVFRGFMSACQMALETAVANTKNANGDVGSSGYRQLRVRSEGGGEYHIFDGTDLWQMIYEQTMANAVFNKNDGDVIAWIDDLPTVSLSPPLLPSCSRKIPLQLQQSSSEGPGRASTELDEDEPGDETHRNMVGQEAAHVRRSSASEVSHEDEEMAMPSFETV